MHAYNIIKHFHIFQQIFVQVGNANEYLDYIFVNQIYSKNGIISYNPKEGTVHAW